jgi:transposase
MEIKPRWEPGPGIRIVSAAFRDEKWIVKAEASGNATCPSCHHQAIHRHSCYTRRVRDLPVQGTIVELHLRGQSVGCQLNNAKDERLQNTGSLRAALLFRLKFSRQRCLALAMAWSHESRPRGAVGTAIRVGCRWTPSNSPIELARDVASSQPRAARIVALAHKRSDIRYVAQ